MIDFLAALATYPKTAIAVALFLLAMAEMIVRRGDG